MMLIQIKFDYYNNYKKIMGATLQYQKNSNVYNQGTQGRLRSVIKISEEELSMLKDIIRQRSNFKHPYLCTVQKYINHQDNTSNVFCQTLSQVIIQYEEFDFVLADAKQNCQMNQIELQRIIYAVSRALLFLEEKKCRHGDISTKTICRFRNDWRLIDNYFIRGGVTAYEKVLEGEVGFISPAQMEKIRHGFVKESPIIEQSDDVFALGMTCLELMSGKPSTYCYKESFIRFNDKNFNQLFLIIQKRYPQQFVNLIMSMINFNEQKRIHLRQILNDPMISKHGKKHSLRISGN